MEIRIDQILRQLDSHDSQEAWSAFIDDYGFSILQVVRYFEHDADNASDCFQFICEGLCQSRFRRLRRFKPNGPAKFSTWLRAVVRNLCVDWRRKRFGRRRVFHSIAQLSHLDREVFRCIHEQGQSEQETMLSLASRFPSLTMQQVAESVAHINNTLTTNQNWLIRARAAIRPWRSAFESENHQHAAAVDLRNNPETMALAAEQNALLSRALGRLSHREKLLIRLRFEEDLTLEQIAKLLDLGNPQRVDRQIKQILASLRIELKSENAPKADGKTSRSSVKAN